MLRNYFLCIIFIELIFTLTISGQPITHTRYLTYEEARPLLEFFKGDLPTELNGKSSEAQAALWDSWCKSKDTDVHRRLRRGDEDTLINFLLFGVSFTKQKRVTVQDLSSLSGGGDSKAVNKLIHDRIDDLIKSLNQPGNNERLYFLRKLVIEQGQQVNLKGQAKLREYILSNLHRTLMEQESYARTLATARLQGNPSEEFIERSKLYRERGLSLDTTLAPNFAIEESLKAMKTRGFFASSNIRNVAIIGPGLDFTDKASGYDFYPEQTIQPFALINSLVKLGLAKGNELYITAIDISPRVIDHITRARKRVQSGASYILQLPQDFQSQWKPELVKYWETFGDQIGKPVSPIPVPIHMSNLKLRAVRIAPQIALKVKPMDLNIVYQRMTDSKKFDLIIATNILVYYDVFEQSLALANIESMLRDDGFLLSNNVLLELPFSKIKSVDYSTVVYSNRPGDGDHIVWYQRVGGVPVN